MYTRTTECLALPRFHVRLGQPEISQLGLHDIPVSVGEKYVFGLQIPMDDAFSVQKGNSLVSNFLCVNTLSSYV